MEFTEAQSRFILSHRVARLATVSADGQPHVIPVCYAFDGVLFFSPIDEKPKRVGPSGLRRVQNIRANPRVALVIDDYLEDWTALAYLLVRGRAEIIQEGPAHEEALRLLRERYPQYRAMALEERPVLCITPESVVAWGRVGSS